ncbi:dipeptide ABC transporter ATP-binding protein [Xinfangfangia pollutisoli]|uniref:dipeptide ABC transporter ATP-binding protein n=1 Tax=Xinfangfangia pollutisoli TaxID=2865960 RepID=UPI001CD598F9|nr:ABC transporter ATP-binding protein [Xinfangfangia pollutisoli]
MLKVENLSVVLADGTPIVRDIEITIAAGQTIGLVGESGSGKSTIARALLGQTGAGVRIASGRVSVDGRELLSLSPADLRNACGRIIAYVPQDSGAALNPALTVGRQIIERLLIGPDRLDRAEAFRRVAEVLTTLGLPSDKQFLARRPGELSGGQLQRIGLAIAVVARPKVLILDEPTTALDTSTRGEVITMVRQLTQSMGAASLYVSHDLGLISAVADAVTVLYAGEIVETASAQRLFAQPAHPYTRALLEAVPQVRQKLPIKGIPGQVPDLDARLQGCSFADRCSAVQPKCRESKPALAQQATGRVRCFFPSAAPIRRPGDLGPETVGDHGIVYRVDDLAAGYPTAPRLLDGISLALRRGKCTALVGESGSGKSTLSRCLIGLQPITEGRMGFADAAQGAGLRDSRRMQYIFQDPSGSLNPRRKVGDSISLAARHFFPGEDPRPRVEAALARVDLSPAILGRFPSQLSGGQKQRVAIARALVAKPEVLLCDEITSALDVSVQASVLQTLKRLMDDGLSLLFVTHDLGVVRTIADEIIVLKQGRIVEQGPADQVFATPEHPYTRMLLDNVLELPAGVPA